MSGRHASRATLVSLRLLYGVCAWGLGHATRSLPILRRLVLEHDVLVYSDGPALALLRSELDGAARFADAPPYPNIFGGALALRFFARAPGLVRAMRAEHRETQAIVGRERIDRIVSDSRWGVSSPRVPSFFISHHLKQLAPDAFRPAERLTEAVTWRALHGRYRRILVPDVDAGGGLSGRLAHELHYYRLGEVKYVGPLSDVTPQPVAHDVDTLVVLSGPEPSRSELEARLEPGLPLLPGKTVVLRGIPDGVGPPWTLSDVEALPHAPKPIRDALFSRARVVVSRSGYTTVMDTARVGTRALFVPMRGQTEQEYLARRLARRGLVHAVPERALDLVRDVAIARERPGLGAVTVRGVDSAGAALEEILA